MHTVKNKYSGAFKAVKWLAGALFPKFKTDGLENLPEGPCIIVGNHSQMNGPVAAQLYFPDNPVIWCAGEMMDSRELPGYAFKDFWSFKPKWTHPFYKLLSYLIVPLCMVIFSNADILPVYKDSRVISTFRKAVLCLQNGKKMIIFPEQNIKYNNIIYDFQDKFIDVARFYYKKTGNSIKFVPMYLAPNLKKMYIGKPVAFDPHAPVDDERARIKKYLMDSITDIAVHLPEHTVVPYRNIPKKLYPKNYPEVKYEKTGC